MTADKEDDDDDQSDADLAMDEDAGGIDELQHQSKPAKSLLLETTPTHRSIRDPIASSDGKSETRVLRQRSERRAPDLFVARYPI